MFEPGGGGEDQIFTRGTDPQHQTEIEFGTEKTKKKTKKNKKRFTDDQVRWLESLFENETKLEPKQKVEAARELGLHPRQVAIWFQNKRARWKSKLLQRDFDLLRSNYDSLSSRFDSLKKQNLSLSLQLQKLKELVGDTEVAAAKDEESKTKNKNNKVFEDEEEKKPELGIGGGTGYEMGMMREENYFAMEQGTADLVAMVEPACSSLTSDEEWHGLHSDGLFDQSTSSCEWWDFWS